MRGGDINLGIVSYNNLNELIYSPVYSDSNNRAPIEQVDTAIKKIKE